MAVEYCITHTAHLKECVIIQTNWDKIISFYSFTTEFENEPMSEDVAIFRVKRKQNIEPCSPVAL